MKDWFRVKISVGRMDFDFVDLRRTRDFPNERDWSVLSISASSTKQTLKLLMGETGGVEGRVE